MSLSPSASGIPEAAALDATRPTVQAKARLAETLVAAALILSLALRVMSPALAKPLWLDEAWTGMMAAQTTASGLIQQIRDDVNAPLYYILICLWAKVAGLSNIALRAPNILFGLGAAGVGLCSRRSLAHRTAAVWGVLLALWWPAIVLSFDARCYLLLLLMSTLTVAAHIRLMERPTRGRATVWAVSACLTVLTHYHAALLVGAQAVMVFAVHRQRALKLWPAALAFLPGVAWCLYHLPRITQFAQPGVAWYMPFKAADLLDAFLFLCSGPTAALSILGLGVFSLATTSLPAGWKRRVWRAPSPAVCAVAASLLGLALCLAAAALRPSYTLRYLTPFAPGVLLGVALLTHHVAKRISLASFVIPLAFAVTAVHDVNTLPDNNYSFEAASAYLQQGRPQRLEFFWDHPATQVEAPGQLRQVGGFFFARAGYPIRVDPIILSLGEDPNRVLTSHAERGSAILWLYDLSLRGVAANLHSPSVLEHDPHWRCRNFGEASIGVLACREAPL